ncbi:MAG: cell shape-determining protein MreD, partial [Thiovulaceae bacterium]|nr:cell shape-determining protein MreD [Sulfurimonadaceae bacterium]
MSTVIGKITNIDGGKFYIKSEDGSLREVTQGYEILEGESIVGADSNSGIDSVIISLADGSDVVVIGNQEQLFDAMLTQPGFAEPEVVTKNEAIKDLVEEYGEELDIDDIETAAGEEEAVESSGGGEADFADFNGAATDVKAGLRNTKFDGEDEIGAEQKEDEKDKNEEVAVDFTDTSAEDTTPEDTIPNTPEDTTSEDTTPPTPETTVDEDTRYEVEEDTIDGIVNTQAADESTTPETTTDALAENTVDENTADATAESTTPESTTEAVTEDTSDV